MNPTEPRSADDRSSAADSNGQALGSIALRQVRVNRADVPAPAKDTNPMNRLVPYLDLYSRLSDDELARLASVPPAVVANLRRQVIQVDRALSRFTDLLPRLTDAEMVRLTGATPKTIRFWRLCQPRSSMSGADAEGWSVAQAAETLGRVHSSSDLVRPLGNNANANANVGRAGEAPLESGIPGERHVTNELERQPTGEVRRVEAETRPTTEMRRMGTGPLPTAESRRVDTGTYSAAESRRHGDSGLYSLVEGARRRATSENPRSGAVHRPPAAQADGVPLDNGVPVRRATSPSRVDPSRPPSGPQPASQSGSQPMVPRPPTVPHRGRTQEVPAAASTPPVPNSSPEHPDVRLKQKAASDQMSFSGAPFPGNDAESSEPLREDDGIFIGLELPDPRTLVQPGRRD